MTRVAISNFGGGEKYGRPPTQNDHIRVRMLRDVGNGLEIHPAPLPDCFHGGGGSNPGAQANRFERFNVLKAVYRTVWQRQSLQQNPNDPGR
jgi:hypothetical protein